MFSEEQAVTVDADSTNILDLLAHGDDVQRFLTLFVQVREAVTSADAGATVTFELYTDDALNEAGTDLAADNLVWSSGAIAKATLVDGYFAVKVPLPPGVQRYLLLKYNVSATLTAGKFDAGLAWGIDLP